MMMFKKAIGVLVLSCLVCLAFSLTAGAVYKGFSPINPSNASPGYLGNDDANALMFANGVPSALQASAHGGYITTTTKCSVCHSLHRATGIPTTGAPGPQNQMYLTSGGSACAGCHAKNGAVTSVIQVEWGTNGGGPHANDNGGCALCHAGGIHGREGSAFYVMNAFMLGGNGDAQLIAELPQLALSAVSGGNPTFYVPPALTGGTDMNAGPGVPGSGNTWWYDGGLAFSGGSLTFPIPGPTEIGGMPGGSSSTATASPLTAAQYSAARSVATSYTCTQTGCHVNTVMANLQWGVGFSRDITDGGIETTLATGHTLPAIMRNNGAYMGNGAAPSNGACGPCHTGTMAGFPTDTFQPTRVAYGCDQCHDMIGVATNSTAFPHGNRDILVYEWIDNGDRTQSVVQTTMTEGNLWMYAGNIARVNNGTLYNPADITANGPTTTSTCGDYSQFADLNWRVLRGVTGGAANDISAALGAAGTYAGYAGLTDGSCLKCHIPLDKASLDALGASAGPAIYGHNPTMAQFPPTVTSPTGSRRLFLYR